ncbi:hypothetical protein ABT56_18130 [Photobacterium aquae]|uniref:Trimeric autotransporter adhesin YadA-like C-terminal membrane anchor domain-containing protein n=1 Tax=Photobacterium aquae TaxID=1195763 RepID=A0A0J1GVQ2_9GAMM|nr:hypothetical protein ABT56_18130 [Photobacterium aquae]
MSATIILSLSATALHANASSTPDSGVLPPLDRPQPDLPADRPEPTDPNFGLQPPLDRPQPDNSIPDRPEPVDPSFGVTPKSDSDRINALETAFEKQVKEHNEQMDGIRASFHAVTNARPFVTDGEFAIGAGVGFAGSKEALAVGGAYGFNNQWSVSGTFHYENAGTYSSSEVAGGVGVQYKFK